MVRRGEILSQALSGVSDELLDGARELFEKSEEELAQTQKMYDIRRQAVKRKLKYAMSAVAAACIFIVLGMGIAFMSSRQGILKVYYGGVPLDGNGTVAAVQSDDEPDIVSYSLEEDGFQDESEFTFHIKARGSFTIEASSGGFLPDGGNVVSASDEADVVWAVTPHEGAYLTVSAGTQDVRVELHTDESTGVWMFRAVKGQK